MKKVIVILAGMLLVAGTAGAALIDSTGTTIGSSNFQASTNVQIDVKSSTTDYVAASKHKNGDRAYASGSSFSEISEITTNCSKGTDITDSMVSSETTLPTQCQ